PAEVGRRLHGLRQRLGGHAVVDRSGRGGEPLGGNDLGGLRERELAARHATGELDRLAPAGAHSARTADREAETVALVGVRGRAEPSRWWERPARKVRASRPRTRRQTASWRARRRRKPSSWRARRSRSTWRRSTVSARTSAGTTSIL